MSNKKIIILENSKINFNELNEDLKASPGVDVLYYTDLDSFQKAITQNPDLIVIDALTPGFNFELIQDTKQKTKSKVVILTNNKSPNIPEATVDKAIRKSTSTAKELISMI